MWHSALVSDPTVCVALLSLSGLLIGAVEDEESDDRKGACIVGEAGLEVVSVDASNAGIAPARVGESGSSDCRSCIDVTIFSRPQGVMCLSLPRLTEKSGYDVFGDEEFTLS